jgi:hypothetical protein
MKRLSLQGALLPHHRFCRGVRCVMTHPPMQTLACYPSCSMLPHMSDVRTQTLRDLPGLPPVPTLHVAKSVLQPPLGMAAPAPPHSPHATPAVAPA